MTAESKRSVGLVAGLALVGLAAAACGGGSGGAQVQATGGSSSPAMVDTVTVTTHSGPLGTYLTDGRGRAVYLFTPDTPTSSKCSGACLGVWPPVVVTGTPHATGDAEAGKLGTLTRSDGSRQATYAGHPLYYFAPDKSAGDTKGEGIDNFGGIWYLLSPTGKEIKPSASSQPSTGGGYGQGWG